MKDKEARAMIHDCREDLVGRIDFIRDEVTHAYDLIGRGALHSDILKKKVDYESRLLGLLLDHFNLDYVPETTSPAKLVKRNAKKN